VNIYLLDNNIWSYWYSKKKDILEKIEALGNHENRLMMSPFVWGELAYGCQLDKKFPESELWKFFETKTFQFCKEIDKHTAQIYGELRAILTNKYDPKRKSRRWIDTLEDPSTSKKLQIQENDLWIVSQAINFGVTFITADKKMKPLLEIIPQKYIDNKAEGFCYQIWGKT